jgi:hypothetical protein
MGILEGNISMKYIPLLESERKLFEKGWTVAMIFAHFFDIEKEMGIVFKPKYEKSLGDFWSFTGNIYIDGSLYALELFTAQALGIVYIEMEKFIASRLLTERIISKTRLSKFSHEINDQWPERPN